MFYRASLLSIAGKRLRKNQRERPTDLTSGSLPEFLSVRDCREALKADSRRTIAGHLVSFVGAVSGLPGLSTWISNS